MSAINVKHKQPLKENHIFQNGLIDSDKSFHVISSFFFEVFAFYWLNDILYSLQQQKEIGF